MIEEATPVRSAAPPSDDLAVRPPWLWHRRRFASVRGACLGAGAEGGAQYMLHRTMSGGFELLDDGTPRRAEPGVDGVANWLAAVRAMPACGLCRATPRHRPAHDNFPSLSGRKLLGVMLLLCVGSLAVWRAPVTHSYFWWQSSNRLLCDACLAARCLRCQVRSAQLCAWAVRPERLLLYLRG